MIVTKEINISHKNGLNILIISGVHGNESHAVKAVYDLYNRIKDGILQDIDKITNTVSKIKWVFNLNEYGLCNEERTNQYSKDETKDINRLFPREFNTVEDIKALLHGEYQIVIDVHNSPNCIPCVLIDYDKYLNKNLTCVEGAELVPLVRHTNIGTIKKHFNNEDTRAFTIELPGMGITGDFVYSTRLLGDFLCTVISNINKQEKQYEVELPIDLYTKVEQGIIYYMNTNPLLKYSKGAVIAKVEDINTGEREDIIAPFDGILYDINETVYVSNLNSIGMFGKEIFK